MSLDHFSADLSLKTVNLSRRIIAGYAAAHDNVDRVNDIIDPSASHKAIALLKSPSDVAVFIGHNTASLPIGIPQKIEATPRGLYTETYILKGPIGDNLLAVAKDLQDHGMSLGMSIGYRTHDSRHETAGRKKVRRIMSYELKEFSYAAQQAIANPLAVVTDVKAKGKEGRMDYSVEQEGNSWLVKREDRTVGIVDDERAAYAVKSALEGQQYEPEADDEHKAVWTTKYVNDLPNSSFLFVEPGDDDEEGKRVPRSKRHFPYKDDSGKIDLPHLRNAIARIPQSDAPGLNKPAVQARARRLLAQAEGGKTSEEGEEWKTGAALSVLALGYQLIDLAEALAEKYTAMRLLGEDHKTFARIPADNRALLASISTELAGLARWADTIERGEEAKARRNRLAKELALLSI
jgi:HK97 family phage prohead protease